MPQPKEATEVTVGQIHENNLSMVDFGESCLKIGVRREGQPKMWMELDEDDFRILWQLLNKPLMGDGTCAADSSKALKNLASYAEHAAAWLRANPSGVKDE